MGDEWCWDRLELEVERPRPTQRLTRRGSCTGRARRCTLVVACSRFAATDLYPLMAPLYVGAWASTLLLAATAHLGPAPAAAAAAAEAAAATRCAIAHDKVIGAGHNFGVAATVTSYPACCALCQQHAPACKAWTWHPPDSKTFPSKCLMHSENGPTIPESGVISGVPSAHLPPPAPPPPPPPLNCPASRNFSSAAEACAAFDLPTKIDLMHGFGWGGQDAPTPTYGYSRNSGCGCACGRQYFRWDNGPQGFGDRSGAGNSTQWPSTLNAAATFDPELCEEWGTAMGEEFWNKGSNIQEGPGLNIARIEKNGRTFEYLSGVPVCVPCSTARRSRELQSSSPSHGASELKTCQERTRSSADSWASRW